MWCPIGGRISGIYSTFVTWRKCWLYQPWRDSLPNQCDYADPIVKARLQPAVAALAYVTALFTQGYPQLLCHKGDFMQGKIIDLQMNSTPTATPLGSCGGACCIRKTNEVSLSGLFVLSAETNPVEFAETVTMAIDALLSGKELKSESDRVKELETELYKVRAQEQHLRKAFKQWRSASTAAGMQFKDLIKLME